MQMSTPTAQYTPQKVDPKICDAQLNFAIFDMEFKRCIRDALAKYFEVMLFLSFY